MSKVNFASKYLEKQYIQLDEVTELLNCINSHLRKSEISKKNKEGTLN